MSKTILLCLNTHNCRKYYTITPGGVKEKSWNPCIGRAGNSARNAVKQGDAGLAGSSVGSIHYERDIFVNMEEAAPRKATWGNSGRFCFTFMSFRGKNRNRYKMRSFLGERWAEAIAKSCHGEDNGEKTMLRVKENRRESRPLRPTQEGCPYGAPLEEKPTPMNRPVSISPLRSQARRPVARSCRSNSASGR